MQTVPWNAALGNTPLAKRQDQCGKLAKALRLYLVIDDLIIGGGMTLRCTQGTT